jgi:hypothetical protein
MALLILRAMVTAGGTSLHQVYTHLRTAGIPAYENLDASEQLDHTPLIEYQLSFKKKSINLKNKKLQQRIEKTIIFDFELSYLLIIIYMDYLFHFFFTSIWRDQTFVVCIQVAFIYFVLHVLFRCYFP